MKLKTTLFVVILATASIAAFSAATLESTPDFKKGIKAQADVISAQGTRLTMTGSVLLRGEDKFSNPKEDEPISNVLVSSSKRTAVEVFPTSAGKSRQSGIQALKSMVMDGPVTIEYTSLIKVAKDETNPTGQITTKATVTADDATYDGKIRLLTFTGNVKLVREDPRIFEEPSVTTANIATIDLSSPEPVFTMKKTTIEALPKAKDDKKTK